MKYEITREMTGDDLVVVRKCILAYINVDKWVEITTILAMLGIEKTKPDKADEC